MKRKKNRTSDPYYNYDFESLHALNESDIHALGERFKNYVRENEDLRSNNALLRHFGINLLVINEWIRTYPFFEYAYDGCLQIIATRREERALEKDPSGRAFWWTQHEYDKVWYNANKYHAQLKQHEMAAFTAPKIVEIPVFLKESDDTQKERNALEA